MSMPLGAVPLLEVALRWSSCPSPESTSGETLDLVMMRCWRHFGVGYLLEGFVFGVVLRPECLAEDRGDDGWQRGSVHRLARPRGQRDLRHVFLRL
jgi:hypothetical protein